MDLRGVSRAVTLLSIDQDIGKFSLAYNRLNYTFHAGFNCKLVFWDLNSEFVLFCICICMSISICILICVWSYVLTVSWHVVFCALTIWWSQLRLYLYLYLYCICGWIGKLRLICNSICIRICICTWICVWSYVLTVSWHVVFCAFTIWWSRIHLYLYFLCICIYICILIGICICICTCICICICIWTWDLSPSSIVSTTSYN